MTPSPARSQLSPHKVSNTRLNFAEHSRKKEVAPMVIDAALLMASPSLWLLRLIRARKRSAMVSGPTDAVHMGEGASLDMTRLTGKTQPVC